MFLTHKDDVADHAAFAREFGCERVMSEADGAVRLGVERVIEGEEEARLDDDLLVIPTPGHTRGHQVLLYREKFLFTGDHLWWNREHQRLGASRTYNWCSWPKQIESMRKLADESFEWVLPGHGQRIHLDAVIMRQHMHELVTRMEQNSN